MAVAARGTEAAKKAAPRQARPSPYPPAGQGTLRVEREGRVLRVVFDDPPRNYLSRRLVSDLDEVVARLRRDRSVRAVVFTGGLEDIFVTHLDVAEYLDDAARVPLTVPRWQARAMLRLVGGLRRFPGADRRLARSPLSGIAGLHRMNQTFLRLRQLDKVVIAAINGTALGGGCIVALACDIRLMADGDFRIGLPEARIGFLAGATGSQKLTRLIGSGALRLLLEGDLLHPSEAKKWGLVDEVVAPDELEARSMELAERLARRPPYVIREVKRSVYELTPRRFSQAVHLEAAGTLVTASQSLTKAATAVYLRRIGAAPDNDTITEAWRAVDEEDLFAAEP
jgi:enoyl-CoA hydratase